MEDYSKLLIKDYRHWSVSVHPNQSYLGRCVIWCKREDALDLTEATQEEQLELFIILNECRDALEKTFKPDWLNYAFLGNEVRHLHGHLIPRYASPKIFKDTEFVDTRWGQNYLTDKSFVTSPELLEEIKIKLKQTFNA